MDYFDKKEKIYKKIKYLLIFFAGAAGYGMLEMIYRGRTHWSMMLTGGAGLITFYLTDITFSSSPFYIKAFVTAALITLYEFSVGCIVNIKYGLGVWDYSNQRYSLMGQICPVYSFMWFLLMLCLAGISLFFYNKKHKRKCGNKRRTFK